MALWLAIGGGWVFSSHAGFSRFWVALTQLDRYQLSRRLLAAQTECVNQRQSIDTTRQS